MYRDILLTIELGRAEDESQAVHTAVEYARTFGSRLHLLTVLPDYGMPIVGSLFPAEYERRALEATRQALRAYADAHIPAEVPHRHIVGHGSIYREILRCADETMADLIVMSAGRPDLQDYLIGPNAARVARHARVSVLVVRSSARPLEE